MKSKIIIHNETDLTDGLALILASKVVYNIPEYTYFEFSNGYKAQGIKTKTGKTIYIYGGNSGNK